MCLCLNDATRNLRFLERLLADYAPVDEVWAETGETALLMAIGYGDVEVSVAGLVAGLTWPCCCMTHGVGPIVANVLPVALSSGITLLGSQPTRLQHEHSHGSCTFWL